MYICNFSKIPTNNNDVIKNSGTVYAGSIGNTKHRRETMWIIHCSSIKGPFKFYSTTGIYSICAGHWTFLIRMNVKQDTKKKNKPAMCASRKKTCVKVFLKARKGKNSVSTTNDLKLRSSQITSNLLLLHLHLIMVAFYI